MTAAAGSIGFFVLEQPEEISSKISMAAVENSVICFILTPCIFSLNAYNILHAVLIVNKINAVLHGLVCPE
jgi:hypothetical protein